MATVMQWGNSEGIQGRCDAKCHNARGSTCHCMCGGRYHGAEIQPGGLKQAMEQHEQEVESVANAWAKDLGLAITFKSLADLFTHDLFGETKP